MDRNRGRELKRSKGEKEGERRERKRKGVEKEVKERRKG